MAHQVLARKWRPRIFADVIGQDHVVRALANALDTGRIHHAYLFTGTRGVGKTTLARILAKALNCEVGVSSKPCGVCKACTDIDAGRFVDLLEVDAATNTKVDEMRELLETAQYAPVSGRYKVYIIDEVHMLSKSAFNAMLKTLEEPPGHVEFILATTDPQKLPITVLSRCLQFNLKNLPPALIAGHLATILAAEQIGFEKPALDMIGRAAEGSVRDSLSLLDQAIAYGAGSVNSVNVAAMLGALDQSYLFSLLDCVAENNPKQLVAEIEQLAARSISFDITLKDLAGLLTRVAMVQTIGGDAIEGPDAARIVALSAMLKPESVQLLYQIALLGRRDLSLSPDEQSGFTMTMLRMLAFAGVDAGSKRAVNSVGHIAGNEVANKVVNKAANNVANHAAGNPPHMAVPQVAPNMGHGAAHNAAHSAAAPNAGTYGPTAQAVGVTKQRAASSPEQPASTHTLPDTYDVSGADGPDAAFDGNWPDFIARLNLSGMAGMLGKQCEFQSLVNGVLELVLPGAQKHLADKNYQEKLRSELAPHLGKNLRLNIRIGEASGVSLAAHEDRVRSERQANAVAAIAQDPFIQHLKQDFGAEVLSDSIRPANAQ